MKSIGLFLTLMSGLIFFSHISNAQDVIDPYTMKSITVTYDTGNPSKLRNKAISQATKNGFNRLLQLLTPREMWFKHEALQDTIDLDTVTQKFVIVEEQTSPEYRLTVDVTFNKKQVQTMLENMNIPYSESSIEKVLLVPLLEAPGRIMLWQFDNPWRQTLMTEIFQGGHVSFMLPAGDMSERNLLTAEMAAFGAGDVLLRIAEKYGAKTVVVAKAQIVDDYSGRYLEVEHTWHGEQAAESRVMAVPFPQEVGYEDLLSQGAEQTLALMEDSMRSSDLVRVDKPGRVFLRFTPSSAADLEKLKVIVSDVKVMKELTLRVLNVQDSVFQADFFGDPTQFQQQLIAKGLFVTPTPMNMVWRVAFTEPRVSDVAESVSE